MTATATAITTTDDSAIVISAYQALMHDLAIEAEKAPHITFDYRDEKGNKEARAYVHSLRRIKGRVETARKEAKSEALAFGRAVDARAREMEAKVVALITPHLDALNAIEQEEVDRVKRHTAVLDHIVALRSAPLADPDDEVAELENRLTNAMLLPIGPELEEFQGEAEKQLLRSVKEIDAMLTDARRRKAEREELETLRAEAARRDAADREEALRQAALAQAQAQAQAQLEAAEVAKAEAERRAEQAEQAAAEMVEQREREESAAQERAARDAELAEERAMLLRRAEAERLERATAKREEFLLQLRQALAGKTRIEVAEALADGTLHPALSVDWRVL